MGWTPSAPSSTPSPAPRPRAPICAPAAGCCWSTATTRPPPCARCWPPQALPACNRAATWQASSDAAAGNGQATSRHERETRRAADCRQARAGRLKQVFQLSKACPAASKTGANSSSQNTCSALISLGQCAMNKRAIEASPRRLFNAAPLTARSFSFHGPKLQEMRHSGNPCSHSLRQGLGR